MFLRKESRIFVFTTISKGAKAFYGYSYVRMDLLIKSECKYSELLVNLLHFGATFNNILRHYTNICIMKNSNLERELRERVRIFLDSKGVKQTELANKTGLNRSVISEMLNGKRSISRLANRLEEIYELDYNYFKEGIDETGRVEQKPHFISIAHAGLTTAEQGTDYEMEPIISQLPKYDYTVEVRGDSMYPEYKSGDIVACLNVTNDNFIQWGRTHLLNTSQGVVIKKIYLEGDCIKCVSVNSEEYPPFNIPRENIYSVGLVVGAIRIC